MVGTMAVRARSGALPDAAKNPNAREDSIPTIRFTVMQGITVRLAEDADAP